MREGVSGWLSPDGKFISCGFMEHAEVARQIVQSEQLEREQRRAGMQDSLMQYGDEFLQRQKQWISMGGGLGHIHYIGRSWNTPPTEAQYKWFISNFESLSEDQQRWATEAINDYEFHAKGAVTSE